MAIPTAATHTDDTTMTWASIAANLTLYRNWLNDLPLADIAAGAVQSEHIVRPVIQGFPTNTFTGQKEIIQWASYGLDAAAGLTPETWARRPRITIVPYALAKSQTWRTPLGFTVKLPASARVQVNMTWEWYVRAPIGVALPSYPNSATGTPTEGGAFTLFTFQRADSNGARSGDPVEQSLHRNYVYPMSGLPSPATAADEVFHSRGKILFNDTLAAGTWDIFLGYVGEDDRPGIEQIDVSRFSGKLEAHM